MTKFGENLALLRRRAGMTQEGLAEALDVSRQAVGKWEAGLAYPAAEKLPALADVLGCSLDELLRGGVRNETEANAPVNTPVPEEAPVLTLAAEDAPTDMRAPEAAETAEEEEIPAPDVPDAAVPTSDALAAFAAYDAQENRFSLGIAAGVALILMSVSALMFFSMWSGTLSIMALLTLIAAAVGVFIATGLSEAAFRQEYPVVDNLYSPEELRRFRDVFAGGTAIGVGMIVLSPAAILLAADWRMPGGVAISIFMTILAGGVAAIVYLGIQYAKYHFKGRRPRAARRAEKRERRQDLERRALDRTKVRTEEKLSRVTEAENGAQQEPRSWSRVITLSATGLFFILGFVFHLWSICWIVFPMGAILAGIVKAVPVSGQEEA